MKDICCVGHITRDKIITPRHTVQMAGGTAFYFAHGINRLPHEVDFQLITKVGEDSMTEVQKMRHAGIDVVCHSGRHTVYFENRYGADTNKRTQRVLAKADPFTVEEMHDVEARIFHLGSLLADDFPAGTVKYLATKGRISIDAQGYLREVQGENVLAIHWKEKEEILACTDILKLNEHEMEVIANSRNPRTVALQLAESGVREVVITLGSYGSLIYEDGKFHEIPAYKAREVVDATGCGDTYSTGYLYCRAQGIGCLEAGKFAAAMCTLKLERSGPFDRTKTEVEAVMAGR